MTYLQKNNRNRKGQTIKRIVIGLVVIILIVTIFFSSSIRGLIQNISYPILHSKNNITENFSGFSSIFQSSNSLIEENEKLREELKEKELDLITVEILQNEVEELRNFLEIKVEDKQLVVAEVLKRPPFSPYDTMVISAGNDLVSIGDQVLIFGVLAGEISEVYDKTAVVKFYSASNNKVGVRIGDKYDVEAMGKGGLNFSAELPKDIEIEVGDAVTSVDKNKVIGVVQAVEVNEVNTFQTIYFNYPFNLFDAGWVGIVKNDI